MKNDKVIYTCVVGAYDDITQPLVQYEGYDYVCFTNESPQTQIGVWQIRPIPYTHSDNTRLSRYVKLNPHEALAEYKYSVWIDLNMQIMDYYLRDRVEEAIAQGAVMASVQHPSGKCIYKDAIACIKAGKEYITAIYKQVKFLRSEGYPENYGLYENNIILREHNDPTVRKISEEWWDIYLRFSRRDQLSLCYILWRNNFTPTLLFPAGTDTNSQEHFKRSVHNQPWYKYVRFKIKKRINKILYKFLPIR